MEPVTEHPKEERRRALIDKLARKIAAMKLEGPAVFFLEATRPLSFIGSQAMIFLEPLVQTLCPMKDYRDYAELFENRRNVELLIREIELKATDRRKEGSDR